jgi:protein-disulfide isomerase
MSRARTVERRKEREAQKRRQRQITIIAAVVITALVLGILFVLVNAPAEAPIPADSAALYKDLPQSKTDDGFPVLGSAAAPVKVLEYSSFDCPHCQEFHTTVTPRIVERVRKGEVQFTYIPMYGTGGIANGQGAGRAAICASEQGAFWTMHDALFNWQGLYANQAFSGNRLTTGVDNLKINRAQWDQCMASTRPDAVLAAAMKNAGNQNVSGTPTVLVNGSVTSAVDLTTINSAIDKALAEAGGVPAPVVESTTEATAEATKAVTTESTAEATTQAKSETTPEATAKVDATAEATAKP